MIWNLKIGERSCLPYHEFLLLLLASLTSHVLLDSPRHLDLNTGVPAGETRANLIGVRGLLTGTEMLVEILREVVSPHLNRCESFSPEVPLVPPGEMIRVIHYHPPHHQVTCSPA